LFKNLWNIRNSLGPFIYPLCYNCLESLFMNFDNPTFRGWHGFTKFPNTSPSRKRVDSDDPYPWKPLNFGKKRHPRNVGVDMRPPEISQRSNRGSFLELPPLAPINRQLWP
jgi:hypothetical protein